LLAVNSIFELNNKKYQLIPVISYYNNYITVNLLQSNPIFFVFCFRYSAEEIHFNLMAIISSRKEIHLKDIDRLNQRKTQILDKVGEVHLLPKWIFLSPIDEHGIGKCLLFHLGLAFSHVKLNL